MHAACTTIQTRIQEPATAALQIDQGSSPAVYKHHPVALRPETRTECRGYRAKQEASSTCERGYSRSWEPGCSAGLAFAAAASCTFATTMRGSHSKPYMDQTIAVSQAPRSPCCEAAKKPGENTCVSATAGRPGTSASRSKTAIEHLHREAALLADVAKQPPAAGAPRKQRQPAAAGHREVAAVGAERRVPERPVGCQVRCRRPQMVHLQRLNPVMQRTKASASDARNMQSGRSVGQRRMLVAACGHLTSRSLRLDPELPSPKALPTPLPSGCSLISSTLSAACMHGAHGFGVGHTPPYCGKTMALTVSIVDMQCFGCSPAAGAPP